MIETVTLSICAFIFLSQLSTYWKYLFDAILKINNRDSKRKIMHKNVLIFFLQGITDVLCFWQTDIAIPRSHRIIIIKICLFLLLSILSIFSWWTYDWWSRTHDYSIQYSQFGWMKNIFSALWFLVFITLNLF